MTRGMQKFCSLLLILCVLVSGFPAGGFAVRQDTAEFPEPETAGLSADESAEPGMPPQSVTVATTVIPL